MVLATMKFPQLQFLNEVIDVPGMQAVRVLPSRSPVVCNDRFPAYVPQLQLTNEVVYTPVVAQSLIHTAWQTIRFFVAEHMVVDVPVALVVRVPQLPFV